MEAEAEAKVVRFHITEVYTWVIASESLVDIELQQDIMVEDNLTLETAVNMAVAR